MDSDRTTRTDKTRRTGHIIGHLPASGEFAGPAEASDEYATEESIADASIHAHTVEHDGVLVYGV